MSDATTIEWTDATFNPWWGCTKVSPGCDHCYAERDANRFAPGLWGTDAPRRTFGEKHWQQPLTWNARASRAGKRMRVFCASMADVFDKDAPEMERQRLFALIEQTPMLDWQVLTKRVGNVARMVPWQTWPDNVWLGISVVNQDEADRDIPKLLALPARVRFLSCEPLLGPIDLCEYLRPWFRPSDDPDWLDLHGPLSWVIAGGESGPRARPMHPDWARSLRDQCAFAGVPFLFKQWGEWLPVMGQAEGVPVGEKRALADGTYMGRVGKRAAGRMLDGRIWDGYPASLSVAAAAPSHGDATPPATGNAEAISPDVVIPHKEAP